jgi:hypothetical protein
MIRLGYPNCASCHISPQGGGLLNPYGRGIDRAQSLLGGDYVPAQAEWIRKLNWEGRITQDIRNVMQQQDVSTDGKPGSQVFRTRLYYRNATELGDGFRITATIMGDSEPALRPSLAYEPAARPYTAFVTTALLSFRPTNNLEFAGGRDQLPTGVNISDLSAFVRARNRVGYYDAPTHVKAFWWGNRYQVIPYGYAPGGNERTGQHEAGGGLLAEFDVLGHRRTVLGANVLHGTAAAESRTMVGP